MIVGLTACAYATSLDTPFLTHWDDDFYVTGNPRTREPGWSGLARVWSSRDAWEKWMLEYFPLRDSVYWATWQTFGKEPVAFHVVNLFAHLVATLLMWRLVRRIGFSDRVALVATMLFGVHPVHVESVTWISGLKDPLFTALMLGSLNVFVEYRRAPRSSLYAAYVLLLVAALLSKSLALGTPLIALALERCVAPVTRWKEALSRQVGPALISGLFLVQFVLLGKAHAVLTPPHGGSWAQHYLLMAWALVLYVQQAFVPVGFRTFHCFVPFEGLDGRLPALVLGLGLLVVGVVLTVKKSLQGTVLVVWFFVALGPVANLIPFPAIMADRYLYAPSIATCIAMAWAFERLPTRLRQAVTVLTVLCFTAVTLLRGRLWANEKNLWAEAVEGGACLRDGSYQAAMMYVFLGRDTEEPREALPVLELAISHPGFKKASLYEQAGVISQASSLALRSGDPARAKALAARAVDVAPWAAAPWVAMARVSPNPEAAAAALKRAVIFEPTPANRFQYGLALLRVQRPEDGVAQLSDAVDANPLVQCAELEKVLSRAPAEIRETLAPVRQRCRASQRSP